jgi:hypothetical protein
MKANGLAIGKLEATAGQAAQAVGKLDKKGQVKPAGKAGPTEGQR